MVIKESLRICHGHFLIQFNKITVQGKFVFYIIHTREQMSCRGFELFSQINIHPVQQNGFSNMAHSEKRISKYDMIVLDYHGVGHEPNTKKKS